MAELPPWLLQECFTAAGARLFTNNLVCGEGVADLLDGSLLVTTGGAGLDLSVAEGGGFVDSDADDMGMYSIFNDGAVTVTATTADGTNPRIDQVIATVNDSQISGVDNNWVLSVLAGTPTAGASLSNLNGAAALPDRSIRLAYVLVPASFAGPFVNATHILDDRSSFDSCSGTPYVELEASAVTAITPASTYVKVNLDVVRGDAAYFTVASSVVTVLQDGLYQCNAFGGFDNGVSGDRYYAISKNGTSADHSPGEAGNVSSTVYFCTLAAPPVRLVAGDTLQLVAYQTGQGSLNTIHQAANHCRMSIRKVG